MRIGAVLLVWAALAGAAQPEDPVDRAAEVLARGGAAEVARDGKGLVEAARALELLGARPVEEGEDLATRWRGIARTLGVEGQVYRGRALGPAYRRGTLGPRAALVTEQVFLAGQKAVVAVAPQPGRTLEMQISESERSRICARSIAGPRGSCSWLPVFTRRVTIRVVNPGDQPVGYYLVSN
jgi:hypothetical protein